MDSLCALVPVTSKGRSSPSHCREGLRLLGASLSSGATDGAPTPALSVVLGLDSDDPLVDLAEEACKCFLPGVQVAVRVFGGGELAAQRRQCDADPGFPSFPVMHASHLQLFGSMVPREFVNQGGDPLLYALYRSIGAAAVCPTVTVHNTVGGMQGSIFAPPATSAAQQPRYDRRPLPVAQWRSLLQAWRQQLLASLPQARARLQVAVAVPAGRVDCAVLETILERSRSSDEQVDVSVFFQIDCPLALVAPAAAERLRELQRAHPDRLRIRVNSNNQASGTWGKWHVDGAAATRNALLDEAAACDVVVFYDDDVLPAPSCLDAYVAAFRAHPGEAGFAGPTYLPRRPSQLLATAIHMSDVSFFWEAPGRLGEFVPWAVTANMAVAGGTPARFRPGFPKTASCWQSCN
ncbi:hypothetical protein D9Q98_004757 [Chlorella vulgaris]|uniref:Uncharacterized protein n=1 Tax=Chlorella vulgaris TaxID=3077 RepID=A0A9D4TQ97_CHLVU|nr:hypothetical protein D9Q98_004757 [Chlorella vulgaris]